jgi:hypothetical protein
MAEKNPEFVFSIGAIRVIRGQKAFCFGFPAVL